MTDVTYEIHTAKLELPNPEYNTGDPNDWTRGETVSFEFEFPFDFTQFEEELVVSSSYTVSAGTEESYRSVIVEMGATLTIEANATLNCDSIDIDGTVDAQGHLNIIGFENKLEPYEDYAGSYSPIELMRGKVRYREQLPANAPIESLLWGVEPSNDLKNKNVIGVWGLVDNIENNRNTPLTTQRYQVDLYVLAPFDEYDTIEDALTNLER